MSDNIQISTAGGNIVVGADEIASVQYQRVKMIQGQNGTNDGDVAMAHASVVGPLPVNSYMATDYMMAAGLGLTPKFAVINLADTGTLVAAVTSKKIRVVALAMTVDCLTGDETFTFKSGAAGTAISGAFGNAGAAAAVIPIVLPFNPVGWFETAQTTLLELSFAVASLAEGCLTYIEV